MEEEPSFPVMKWGLDREVTYTRVRSFGYQSMTTDPCLTASVSSAAGHSTTNDKYWDWAVARNATGRAGFLTFGLLILVHQLVSEPIQLLLTWILWSDSSKTFLPLCSLS